MAFIYVLVGIAVFVLLAYLAGKVGLLKGRTLDEVVLFEDEKLLFEDSDARVVIRTTHVRGNAQHPWSTLRVTNKRVIFAQKSLFGSKRILIALVYYASTIAEGDAKDPDVARRTWGRMRMNLAEVRYDDGGVSLSVHPQGGAYGNAHTLVIHTKRVPAYRAAFDELQLNVPRASR